MYQVKYSLKKILSHYLEVFLYFFPFYIISMVETTLKFKNTVVVCQYISIAYITIVALSLIKDLLSTEINIL